jgi:hypothetical protein
LVVVPSRLSEPARAEDKDSGVVVAGGVLTVISGVLILLPAVATVWVLPLHIPSFRVWSLISDLLVGGAVIAGGAMTLTKKNLTLGIIGAAIPVGEAIFVTVDGVYVLSQGAELSNALPDVVAFIVWPLILVLSIMSLVLLVTSKSEFSQRVHALAENL